MLAAEPEVRLRAHGLTPANRIDVAIDSEKPATALPSSSEMIPGAASASNKKGNKGIKKDSTGEESSEEDSVAVAGSRCPPRSARCSKPATKGKPKRSRAKAATTRTIIPPAHALNLLSALDFAAALGTPLNTAFVVCMVGSQFYPSGKPTRAITKRCRDQAIAILRQFAAENGYPSTYLYTFENPPTGGTGLHANFLLHLPEKDHDRLTQALQQRFEAEFAWRPRAGTFKPIQIDQEILGYVDAAHKLIYGLKGIDSSVSTYSRSGFKEPEAQGIILGKRVGCSQNIDNGARRQARHTYLATLEDLDVRIYLRKWRVRRDAVIKAKLRAWNDARRSPTNELSHGHFEPISNLRRWDGREPLAPRPPSVEWI